MSCLPRELLLEVEMSEPKPPSRSSSPERHIGCFCLLFSLKRKEKKIFLDLLAKIKCRGGKKLEKN